MIKKNSKKTLNNLMKDSWYLMECHRYWLDWGAQDLPHENNRILSEYGNCQVTITVKIINGRRVEKQSNQHNS